MKKLTMEFASNPLDSSMTQNEEAEQLAQIFSEPQKKNGENKNQSFQQIPVNLIEPSQYNKFDRYVGEKREAMVDSIRENGILEPILLRKKPNSEKYELISGENRWSCGMEAGLAEIPSKVIECDDEQAVMMLTEANLINREVSFRERIIAYRQQYDVMKKRSGERNDLQQGSEKIDSLDILAKKYAESRTQMYRYIKTAELSDYLINAVGLKKISTDAAVKLTALSEKSQVVLYDYIKENSVSIKAKQANEIIKAADDLNKDYLDDIFSNENKANKPIRTIKTNRFARYFENVNDANEIEETIEKALGMYFERMAEIADEEEYTSCDEIE